MHCNVYHNSIKQKSVPTVDIINCPVTATSLV